MQLQIANKLAKENIPPMEFLLRKCPSGGQQAADTIYETVVVRPDIFTNVSGIPELIEDGKQGLLVEPESILQLANAIKALLNDAELRTRLGKAGSNKIEKEFNIRTEVDKLIEIWAEIVA